MDRPGLIFPPENLSQVSLEIILKNQSPSGAFIASPNFPTYAYCWFRDSSFIAYSLDLYGVHEASARFHNWAARAVNERSTVVGKALQLVKEGKPLGETEILHTRYTLTGEDGSREEWPNFQLDGFGTWLWALSEHKRMSGTNLPKEWIQAASLTASYLEALWQQPCYDCWEEFSDKVHLHTLAAIYGGLQACQELDDRDRSPVLEAIKTFIFNKGVVNGHFAKFIGSETIDASLLGLCVPYKLVSANHPWMQSTVGLIENLLYKGGGVHRYATDTYFGGGEWVLLAAWLGWYYVETGAVDSAQKILGWIESTANQKGELTEQVRATLLDESYFQPWIERWGPVATPLLWSHAQYLILKRLV